MDEAEVRRLEKLEIRMAKMEALMIRVATLVAKQAGVPQEEIDHIIIEGTRDIMKGLGEL